MAFPIRRAFKSARDVRSSNFSQANYNRYLRIGIVESVDPNKGIVGLRWTDYSARRFNVKITQNTGSELFIPKINDIAVVGFDCNEQAYILRYIVVNQEDRIVEQKTLPTFDQGDRFIEVGGSYIHQKANGDIVLSTTSNSAMILENNSQSIRFETVNYKVSTDAGFFSLGPIKRLMTDITSGLSFISYVRDILQNAYTEYRLELAETCTPVGYAAPASSTFLELVYGTDVDKTGNPIMKNGLPAVLNLKQVAAKLKIKDSTTKQAVAELYIDKEGNISLTGKNINVNGGSVDVTNLDIAQGLEINNPTLGTKGQHVAREHDEVTVPFGTVTDPEHLTLTELGITNLTTLADIINSLLLGSIITVTGTAPGALTITKAVLNPVIVALEDNKISGVITAGASNVYIGDNNGSIT